MKKPRLPTPEEVALFHESNKGTKVKKPKVTAKEVVPSPLAGEGWDEGALKAGIAPEQALTLTLSRKGRGNTPLASLTTRELSKRAKPYGAPERMLDLHGLSKLEAYAKVQQFLARAQRQGLRHVAIITGKGRGAEVGVLRKSLPEWLNEPALRPMVAGFGHAPQEKGGTGVTHVLVKKPS